MMTVSSIKEIDMKGDPRVIAKSPEELLHQLGSKVPIFILLSFI